MRVLQIVTQMNRAGLERRLMDIYRNIDRECIQFDFLTCRREPGYFDAEIESMGGRVYYGDSLSALRILDIPFRFYTFFLENPEYQIVHCHLNQWCGMVLLGAKWAKVSVRIAHARTSLEKCSAKNLIKDLIKLPVNRVATHRFAVSKKAANWLFGKQFEKRHPATIWPNAISVNDFCFQLAERQSYREKLKLGDALTLIHVGNLRPEKNHRFLLLVFKELMKHHNNAKLLLVGQDYMDGQIEQMVEAIGIQDHVVFLGSRSDISQLLNAADVFVFPSLYEGFPGAVLEAQASGLPCIISDTITEEVCLLSTTVQISLNQPVSLWAEAVLSMRNVEREDTCEQLKNAGYDISTLSRDLVKYYSDAVFGEEEVSN